MNDMGLNGSITLPYDAYHGMDKVELYLCRGRS